MLTASYRLATKTPIQITETEQPATENQTAKVYRYKVDFCEGHSVNDLQNGVNSFNFQNRKNPKLRSFCKEFNTEYQL